MSSLKPLNGRIVVLPEIIENKSAGGIVLPGAENPRPTSGKVLVLPPQCSLPLHVGDTVLFADSFETKAAEHEGQEVLLVKSSDLYAVDPAS